MSKYTHKLAMAGLLMGVSLASNMTITHAQSPKAVIHVVEYQAGASWEKGIAPEKQNLGGHFNMVMENFKSGALLANGPTLDDFHGFYMFNVADTGKVEDILSKDQGLNSGVLEKVKVETWQLFMENLGADIGDKKLFILNYHPGSSWEQGKGLSHQKLSKHFQYVGGLLKQGDLLAGGPVSENLGRYIVAAPNTAGAYKIVSDDPGVQAETFIVQIKPWAPFNRQGLKQ